MLYCAFAILVFEVGRHNRTIAPEDRRGASDVLVLFVGITSGLALLLGFGALVLVFWNAG